MMSREPVAASPLGCVGAGVAMEPPTPNLSSLPEPPNPATLGLQGQRGGDVGCSSLCTHEFLGLQGPPPGCKIGLSLRDQKGERASRRQVRRSRGKFCSIAPGRVGKKLLARGQCPVSRSLLCCSLRMSSFYLCPHPPQGRIKSFLYHLLGIFTPNPIYPSCFKTNKSTAMPP